MFERGEDPAAEDGKFARRLRTLKECGCAVLVTGDAPSDVHVDICRRLLGEDARERSRLLVLTDGTFGHDTRLPAGGRREDTELVLAAGTRSAAAGSVPAEESDPRELGDAALDELGLAIVDACRTLEDRHGPFEPAELRVGLDSLCPLLDAHGEQPVFEFLTVLTRYVRAHDALGHVHLPVDRGAEVARLVAPMFDAVVEVRAGGEAGQHRWHLDEGDLTSRWLPI